MVDLSAIYLSLGFFPILPLCEELGIGFVCWSTLGVGFTTDAIDASKNEPLIQITITNNQNGPTVWLQPVTEEAYHKDH